MNRRLLRHRVRTLEPRIDRGLTGIRIETMKVIDGALREEAWDLYSTSFDELRTIAVQRHVLYRSEFDQIMGDVRVDKLIAIGPDGVVRGIGTITRDLDAMPLISPDYFAARWPHDYARKRIFYIGFVAVHPHAHGTGVFMEMVREMAGWLASEGGIAAMDLCARNDEVLRLAESVDRVVRAAVPDARHLRLDAQSYHAFEFPEPA